MDRNTGKPIEGIDHLRQRVVDVLSTRKNSRVSNRQYGCGLKDLIDDNVDRNFVLLGQAAIAEAIGNVINGIGDFQPLKIEIKTLTENYVDVELIGTYVPTNETVVLEAALRI